jgi:hypothetical protein
MPRKKPFGLACDPAAKEHLRAIDKWYPWLRNTNSAGMNQRDAEFCFDTILSCHWRAGIFAI